MYVAVGERSLLAGRLQQDGSGGAAPSFAYDDRYLADPEAWPLDPVLPLVRGTQRAAPGRQTFGAFADSGPDAWGLSLIKRAELARAQAAGTDPRQPGVLDVLTGVRDDLRQGALRYRHDAEGPFLAAEARSVPALADPAGLADLARLSARATRSIDHQ